MALTVGDKAPEILGTDQNGNNIKLSDFAGKKLALYFYPKDNTSGCTAQAWSVAECQRMLKNLQRAAPEIYAQWEQGVAHCLANPPSGDTAGVCRATMILETATPGSEE